MKTFIVVVLLVAAILVLLAMHSALEMNKENPEEFRKKFQECLDATYAKYGGVIDSHLIVVEQVKKICIVIITLCIIALIF